LGIGSSIEHNIDRWVAVTTQFRYASKAQDKLAVVLIDEATLRSFGSDWPLSYSDIANMGSRIACSGAIAIFFDFTAARYNIEGTSDLLGMVGGAQAFNDAKAPPCRSGDAQPKIPVFFGSIPTLHSPLQDQLNELGRTFLIQTTSTENVYPSGPVEFMDNPPTRDEITPAFGLLQELCRQSVSGARDWCWLVPAGPCRCEGTHLPVLEW
jgi:hypothetical protein